MRVTILQSNFAKALSQISRVVGNRTTLPVLSNALIVAEKGGIKISATDLEVGITTHTTGKIEEEGALTLPAKILSDFINNNKDQSIEITTNANIATLKSERFEAVIHGISAEEFPTVPESQDAPFVVIEKDPFLSSLKKVIIAPALDETRPVLAGILFSFGEKELTLAATDSYRLAEGKVKLLKPIVTKKVIVPTRTMNEVSRILGSSDATKEVSIYLTENQISFKIGDTQIVSRLIEGTFPNYSQIIPSATKIKAKIDLSEMVSAVKMSALFAKDSANNNIRLAIKDKVFIISSTATQAGSAKSTIKAEITGDDIEIAFNARYVLDVLSVLPQGTITIEFNNNASPCMIKTEKDANFIYIIMPLKLEA
jgi:DNA polymerase-3 subunit beta